LQKNVTGLAGAALGLGAHFPPRISGIGGSRFLPAMEESGLAAGEWLSRDHARSRVFRGEDWFGLSRFPDLDRLFPSKGTQIYHREDSISVPERWKSAGEFARILISHFERMG
jgi:hypothetical protein